MKDKNPKEKRPPGVKSFLKMMASGITWLDDAELSMKPAKQNIFLKAYSCLIESNAIILLLLILFSVLLFQHALIDYPRKDHKIYLAQKTNFDRPTEWCKFSASYSRTRTLQKGDEYLFRPAHMLFLCAEDVFFEKKPTVLGTISVVSAGIAAFILFLVCSTLLNNRTGGLLASLCWLAFFPGIELVLWRHISPYLFSLILGFGGIYYFYSNTIHNSITKHVITTTALLFAGLFHEMVIVALIIFAGIKISLWVTNRFRLNYNLELSKALFSILPILVAICLFTAFDLIDFKINGHSFIGPDDTFLENGILSFLWRSAHTAVHFIGFSILALIFPFSTTLAFTGDHLMWVGLPQNVLVILLCAMFGILTMSITTYLQYKSIKFSNPAQLHLVAYSLCFLVTGFLALGFLRGSMRGASYLQWANYYLSIFTWCWIIIFSFLLKKVLDSSASWRRGRRNLIALSSSLATTIYICINLNLITDFTATQYKPRAIQYWVSQGLFKNSEKNKILPFHTSDPQK